MEENMKKLKSIWYENRVLFVLIIILIICAFIVVGVLAKYFFGSSSSKYGDRLEGIEEVQITDEMKNTFLDSMNKDELIEKANIKVIGRVVYVSLDFKDNTTLVEAESRALGSLLTFEQKYLDYYDFNFTLKANKTETSEGFLIMGARNANGNGLVWNNNTEVESE